MTWTLPGSLVWWGPLNSGLTDFALAFPKASSFSLFKDLKYHLLSQLALNWQRHPNLNGPIISHLNFLLGLLLVWLYSYCLCLHLHVSFMGTGTLSLPVLNTVSLWLILCLAYGLSVEWTNEGIHVYPLAQYLAFSFNRYLVSVEWRNPP